MDLISAVNTLGDDYVSKITKAMESSTKINTSSDKDGSFDTIYKSIAGLLDSTNTAVQQAQQAEIDFALGKMTNTHELAVYQQKANVALQYTVAIRDKALEAYKEIMNMSI